ncbi:MAG TPA: zinc ribbon domain-containing protein [Candidatus Acidoferrales bacterium]|nr:zinc ribbon domain-containing protein [Candidatus Acidoferrales bacterium]
MTTMAKKVHSITNDPRMRETQASIASVSDQDFYITRTYGVFHIPARPTTEDYAIVVVTPRGDAIDLGDNRRFPFVISARQIAEDIIQDLQQHGIFVCAAERPTETELATAREVRDAWYRQLVTEADEMWARGHSYREISDMHRRAVMAMKLEREWAYVPQRSVECPACGEKLKAGVALCKHCGATLDADRAAKYFANGPREKFAHVSSGATAHAPAANRKPASS